MSPPSLDRLRRQRDRIQRVVRQLEDRRLVELRRRAGAPVRVDRPEEDRPLEEGPGGPGLDGFPPGGGEGINPHGDPSRPTEAAVVNLAGGRIVRDEQGRERATPDRWQDPEDPVGRALAEVFTDIRAMDVLAARVEQRLAFITGVAEDRRGRVSSLEADCKACGRPVAGTPNDRLRSGYCNACRVAWERAGRPDRARFERGRPKWQPTVDRPGAAS